MRSLLDFMRSDLETHIPKDMIYKQAAIDQMIFFRDTVANLFCPSRDDNSTDHEKRIHFCQIHGWHTSKSIKLPVYLIQTEHITIVCRNNFYNYNTTVMSRKPITIPEYMDIDGAKSYLYFEGMEDVKRGTYEIDHKEFSFCEWNKYCFFSIMWCIASQLKSAQPDSL